MSTAKQKEEGYEYCANGHWQKPGDLLAIGMTVKVRICSGCGVVYKPMEARIALASRPGAKSGESK
jgi:hypothetical protein